MAVISSLIIPVTADASQLGSKLKGAEASIASFAGGVQGFIAGMAAAAFAKFAQTVSEQSELLDKLSKSAEKLGVTGEAMAGLELSAKLSGLSLESLEGSFSKMLRTIAMGSAGNKEAADAFDAIGLKARDLIDMAPDQAFAKIADKISKIENPAAKMNAAFEIFGRQATELMPLLSGGADGLAAMTREARELGLAFSTVDGKKVEAANDAVTKMEAAWDGLGRKAAVAIAPLKEGAANLATDFLKSVHAMIDTGWLPLSLQMGQANADLGENAAAMKAATAAAQAQADALKELEKKQKALAESLTKDLQDPLEKMTMKLKEIKTLFDKGLIDAGTFNRGQLKSVEDALGLGSLRSPQEDFARQMGVLDQAVADGAITWATYNAGLEKAVKNLESASGVQPPEILKGKVQGTREAAEAIIRHQSPASKELSIQERIARATAAAQDHAQKTAAGVDELVRLQRAQGRGVFDAGP